MLLMRMEFYSGKMDAFLATNDFYLIDNLGLGKAV